MNFKKFILFISLTGLMIFLSAGTTDYERFVLFSFNSEVVTAGEQEFTLCDLTQGMPDGFVILQQDTTEMSKQEQKEAKKIERQEKRAAKKAAAAEARREKNQPIPNPNHADYILLGKNLPSGRPLLETIAGRVPGMMIDGDNVMTRGPSSFYSRGDPLFIVDGVPTSKQLANGIPVEQIERIEIFIGPNAAIYGTRASNGVISIYRKNSDN